MKKGWRFVLAVWLGVGLGVARADVAMPLLFSDHMVLQRDAPVKVWGWADPSEDIKVTFGPYHAEVTSFSDGKWIVTLPKMKANATGQDLVIAGKNTVVFHDVLVGDVWVVSGQSNMERDVNSVDWNEDDQAYAEKDQQLRIFHVLSTTSLTPQDDLKPRNKEQWVVSNWKDMLSFSAVGFFFAHEIRKDLGIPIGVIDSSQGGSRAQLWTSVESIRKNVDADPDFRGWLEQRDELVKAYPQRLDDYATAKAKWDADEKQWNADNAKNAAYMAQMAKFNDDFAAAVKEGRQHPGKPRPPTPEPVRPDPPDGGPYSGFMVGNLYNAMIYPLFNYTMKGVLWYQGESNDRWPKQYGVLFPILINDWRQHWGEGDFPFLFVQLPNIYAPAKEPVQNDPWPPMREAQAKALALPNTGMATTIDIGDPWDVHGKDKKDIGERLALIARHEVYGEKNVVDYGPMFESMKIDGGKATIKYKGIGSGLVLGVPPWTPTHVIPPLSTDLKGFAIAGADQKWFWAKAEIKGNRVVVWSADVPKPVAVRYDWADNPPGNLYNKEKLPATPFRTDDWPIPERK